MRVKCIVPEYFDTELQKYIKQDEVFEVEQEKRLNILKNAKVVEEVKEKPNKDKGAK